MSSRRPKVQISALNLLGIAIYPGCDWLLIWAGLGERLIRYRIHMSACSVFCVFGFVYMLVRFRPCGRRCLGRGVEFRGQSVAGQSGEACNSLAQCWSAEGRMCPL